jgi:ABC-type bacteriocin/lantibiotic exporter with double-glycine peptidase domain
VVWLNVPLFPDRSNQCGPAAVAGVLRFWGKDVSMAALKQEIYRDSLKGSLSIDLLLAAQAHGMSARLLEGGMAQVRKELDAGHPLVAFLNQGLRVLPVGHYVVLTGYDRGRGGVYVNSDVRKNAFMSDASFDRQWARGDRWALAMQPAGR